jgi:peptidoglycan/xylan/chitin deacetylase (PgdA/CDA1 family)
MIWRTLALLGSILVAMAAAKARAGELCPGHPDAIGTSRVLSVDPQDYPRIGTVQYPHSVPLEDKEVVLTFDDGPLPPYTNRILDVLAENCVKANYFLVGRMTRGYPSVAERILAEGHTIGTHSENHLLEFDHAPMDVVQREVEQGIASVTAVLGPGTAATSFFRIPGFLRRKEVETYLQSRHLATWSADVVADDWKHINASEVVRRAMGRLEEKGKGIILLHDIQPATALALPELLRELKAKGYRIVQVVPGKTGTSVPVAAKEAPAIAEAAQEKPSATKVTALLPAIVPPKPEADALPPQSLPVQAANSLARVDEVSNDPARPFTSSAKPSRAMPTPGKFVTTEPGGWPPITSVPLPRAGGVGVSQRSGASQSADGRFLSR